MKFRNLYLSQDVIGMMTNMKKWAGHIERMR
jgi:hypothetical protein